MLKASRIKPQLGLAVGEEGQKEGERKQDPGPKQVLGKPAPPPHPHPVSGPSGLGKPPTGGLGPGQGGQPGGRVGRRQWVKCE